MLENIKGYFHEIAATTGTLWGHYDTRASCNHGFASHIVYRLDKIYGKREAQKILKDNKQKMKRQS